MAVHKIPDIVSDTLKRGNLWEADILHNMLLHLDQRKTTVKNKSPALILDIGANIGFFTTYLASQGYDVIAVEPFKINMALLMQTVCMNPRMINRVKAYKIALLDKGQMDMCLWSTNKLTNNGNARLTPAFNGSRDWDNDKSVECMERIPSSTLDQLLFKTSHTNLLRRPFIMKMDIEGNETKTLRGATRLLASDFAPCLIYFEHQRVPTETTGASHDEIFNLLTKAGYLIYDALSTDKAYNAEIWQLVSHGNFRAELHCWHACECSSIHNWQEKKESLHISTVSKVEKDIHVYNVSRNSSQIPKYASRQKFHELMLSANEGEHRRFDKGWSRMNKFLLANHSILKLGYSNIIHEWLSYQIAVLLKIDYIFSQGPATYIHECDDMSKFEAKFAKPLHYGLPVYGMLTRHLKRAEQNSPGLWKQTAKCHDPLTRHMPELSALDFVMGHIDRKANCHVMDDAVIPIDNDAVNYDVLFEKFTNPDQQNILYTMMQNQAFQIKMAKYLLAILPIHPFTKANLDKIRQDANQTFSCHASDAQRVNQLLVVIQNRWDVLWSWLGNANFSRISKDCSVLIFTMDSLTRRVLAAQNAGPAGEIVVRISLQTSLLDLGCKIDIATSDTEFNTMSHNGNHSILIFDPWTVVEQRDHKVLPRELAEKNKNKVYILDFFGSEPNVLGVSSSQILTAFPGFDTTSTFLGFFSDDNTTRSNVRFNRGIIWGKDKAYYSSVLAKSVLETVASICPLVSVCKHASHDFQHSNVTFVGHQSVQDFRALLQSSRFLLGLGHPLSGPSGLEAMQAGAMLIIPEFSSSPYKISGNDNITSQHPYMAKEVGAPYVCTFPVLQSGHADHFGLEMCVKKALRVTLEPKIPNLFHRGMHRDRVAKIFGL